MATPDAPLVPFCPGGEGLLFISQAGTPQQIRAQINGLLSFLVAEGDKYHANHGNRMSKDKQAKRPFIAAESPVREYFPYYCVNEERAWRNTLKKEWINMADAVYVFIDAFFWRQIRTETPPLEFVHRVLPFSTCCEAHPELIHQHIGKLVSETMEILNRRGKQHKVFPFPYAYFIDVQRNDGIAAMKSEFGNAIRSKCDAFSPHKMNYRPEVAKKDTKQKHMSVLFHVTVIENQAYFGFMFFPDKYNGYYLDF